MSAQKESTLKQKVNDVVKKVREDDRTKKGLNYLWLYRLECFLGTLVFIGLLFAFFYINVAGVLIGISGGLCFHKELTRLFYSFRTYCKEAGLFKVGMLIVFGIYLLLALPGFIVASALSFGAASFALKIANF